MDRLFDHLRDKDHIIWDWNGTLLNDVDHALDTINSLLAPRGLPVLDLERYRNTFCFPIRRYYEALGFDLEAESFAELCHVYVEAFMSKVSRCQLARGARELLARVKSAGKTQSVLSATEQSNLDHMIGSFGLAPWFDHVYGIEDRLGASKLHRGDALVRASGVSRERTILVGDTDHDLEVGRALGIPVLLVAHGHQSAERLRKVHDHVIEMDR